MVTELKKSTSLHIAVIAAIELENRGPSDKTIQAIQEEDRPGP